MTDIICCTTKSGNSLPDKQFWKERWDTADTSWDMGHVSPPIEEYMRQYTNKDARILIPGCGNAYEAQFLVDNGFTNISVLDYAEPAAEALRERFKDHDEITVLCEDFFEHHGTYDLIIEQTFFCSLPPLMRKDYVQKSAELLAENGKIIGVMFDRNFEKGPPFGGSRGEYQFLFKARFNIKTMETCTNSIAPRQGSEIFVIFQKKPTTN